MLAPGTHQKTSNRIRTTTRQKQKPHNTKQLGPTPKNQQTDLEPKKPATQKRGDATENQTRTNCPADQRAIQAEATTEPNPARQVGQIARVGQRNEVVPYSCAPSASKKCGALGLTVLDRCRWQGIHKIGYERARNLVAVGDSLRASVAVPIGH